MINSSFSLYLDMVRLAIEAQQVVGMRMMLIANGGAAADRESEQMISEKMEVAAAVAMHNVLSLASGKSLEAIGRHTVAEYSKVVSSNRKRLAQ